MTYKNRKDLSPQFSPVKNSYTKRKTLQNGVEILVHGTVQGVGFRPFIFNLASRFGIYGSVTNTGNGVCIQAYAAYVQVQRFIEAITAEAPPLAKIVKITHRPLTTPLKTNSFVISPSRTTSSTLAIIPPDSATCDDCLRELKDPADFRYGYPFINCTNCGPRFTITESIPYDRRKTSMKVFPMCPDCEREYRDPSNRRFHAQPNACEKCGPHISWHDASGKKIACKSVIENAVQALCQDKILAIRGLGGFHLSVNGFSEKAVLLLRKRKNRPEKPLAIMVANLEILEMLCHVSEKEKAKLLTPEHPILLLKKRTGQQLAQSLSPGIDDIGVMLPYTPLHHLLFEAPGCPEALVMTSGNMSGEPICTSNSDALDKLGSVADYFLLHNREIVTRIDDSVVKYIDNAPRTLRRSRGFVPAPLQVPYNLPEIIGCGGGLKSTFSLGRGNTIFPSQHIGDLFNLSSFDFFTESIANLKKVFNIEPTIAACDLHPDYMSSRYARELGLPLYEIQHHHAHAVAVMAEHGLSHSVLAVILDGTGYGTDGTIWGGEILKTDLHDFTRLGRLEPLQLPGGDTASSEPWRMALSLLFKISGSNDTAFPLLDTIDSVHKNIVIQMLEKNFNSPLTSSCGRLFDGIAALLGINFTSSFEGQAAMQLETVANKALPTDWKNCLIRALSDNSAYLFRENKQQWEIISSEFVRNIVYDVSSGKNRHEIALTFHSWLISCISRLVEKLSESTGIKQVVLSGGCMQNAILLEGLIFTLTEMGFQTFTGSNIPVNDGGISVGQAVIGGIQHVSRSTNES